MEKQKIGLDNLLFELFSVTSNLNAQELEYYVDQYQILIRKIDDDKIDNGEGGSDIIGGVEFYIFNSSLAEGNEIDPGDVFDLHPETNNFYTAITQPENPQEILSKATLKALGEDAINVFSLDTLYIHRIGLLPEYRGNKLGLLILKTVIEKYSKGANLIGLEVGPYDFNKEDIRPNFIEWRQGEINPAGQKKLENYYSKLGFKRIKGTTQMILSGERKIQEIME